MTVFCHSEYCQQVGHPNNVLDLDQRADFNILDVSQQCFNCHIILIQKVSFNSVKVQQKIVQSANLFGPFNDTQFSELFILLSKKLLHQLMDESDCDLLKRQS